MVMSLSVGRAAAAQAVVRQFLNDHVDLGRKPQLGERDPGVIRVRDRQPDTATGDRHVGAA